MVQAIGIWLAALFYVPYIFLAVYLMINVFCSLINESCTEKWVIALLQVARIS